MATSEKRVAANQQNAKKSTGPRTIDGKERARLNAVTHGLTAQTAVLPGEDPAELEALGKSLMRQLKPRGVVQRMMAERVVSLAWKLRRVGRAEEAIAREMDDNALAKWKYEREVNLANDRYIFPDRDRPRRRDCATLLAASWESERSQPRDERLLRVSEFELKLDGALRAAVRELLRLQKEAGAFEDGEDELGLVDDSPWRVESPPAPVGENEPNAADGDGTVAGGTDGPRQPEAAPAACGEAPSGKTNPIAEADDAAQGVDGGEVTPAPGFENSAPVPGTSASPPPGPRR